MPWYILWRILAPINITAHHPIQISPANNKPKSDTPLVHALNIVARPGDSIWDARVNTHGGEESAGVRDASGFIGEKHGKADDAKKGDNDVAEAAFARVIGYVADENGHGGGGGVGGNGEQLGFSGGVAEF